MPSKASPTFAGPQPIYLWADVCGQWRFLSELNPTDLLTPKPTNLPGGVDHASFAQLRGGTFDVFLDDKKLSLEAGQGVKEHGIDRSLDPEEMLKRGNALAHP